MQRMDSKSLERFSRILPKSHPSKKRKLKKVKGKAVVEESSSGFASRSSNYSGTPIHDHLLSSSSKEGPQAQDTTDEPLMVVHAEIEKNDVPIEKETYGDGKENIFCLLTMKF